MYDHGDNSVPVEHVRPCPADRQDGLRKRRRFFKHLAILASVLAIAIVGTVSGASSASAKCKPGRSNDGVNRFDGWYRDHGVGVYSDILNYSPWVNPGSSVSAWAMLQNGQEYAQVGWLEVQYGTRYTFTQWTLPDGSYDGNIFTPMSTGSYTYYTTLWNYQPGYFTFQVNGTTIDTEPAYFTPNRATIDGETHTLADQMPGGTQNNEVFANSHVYISSWQSFNGYTYNSNSTYYGDVASDTYTDEIWDWACSS